MKTFEGVRARNQDGCWSHGPGQGLTWDIVVVPGSTNVGVGGSSLPWLRLHRMDVPGQIDAANSAGSFWRRKLRGY